MYQEQTRPINFIIVDELQKTKNYADSFSRCRDILSEIEKITNSRVLAYFSVFKSSVGVIDSDANVIEDLLRCKNDNKPLLLILNSPGGLAVAAEKILQVCRAYTDINDTTFYTIIPKSAKSAATIIALGSDKILLSKTAELGPIDPQLIVSSSVEVGREIEEVVDSKSGKKTIKESKKFQSNVNAIPAFRIIKAVEELLKKSSKFWGDNRDAYNRFLTQYGYDTYAMSKNEFKLSENILNKILERKQKILNIGKDFGKACRIFFDPEITLSHNRPITISDLDKSPLKTSGFINDYIEFYKNKGLDEQKIKELDSLLWEYYIRTNTHLEDAGNPISKTIETSSHRFHLTSSGQHSLS